MSLLGSISVLLYLAYFPLAWGTPPPDPGTIAQSSSENTSSPESSPASPSPIDILELKIAAAEQIWREKVEEDLIPYGTAMDAVLKGIVNQQFIGTSEADYQFLINKSSFFRNLIERSPSVRRYRQYLTPNSMLTENQLNRKFRKIPAIQIPSCFRVPEEEVASISDIGKFCIEMARNPEALRTDFLYRSLHLLPPLNHLELFEILSLIPKLELLEAHDRLIKKPGVFTRMDFFPDNPFPELNLLHLRSLIQQLNLRDTDVPEKLDYILTATRMISSDLSAQEKIQIYKDILKSVKKLNETQFLQVISELSLFTIWPTSEKPLVAMRDSIRSATQNLNWTASDLHEMNVSSNLALLFQCLNLFHEPSSHFKEPALIKSLILSIFNQSRLVQISTNPNKVHLKSPAERGISIQRIRQLIESRI